MDIILIAYCVLIIIAVVLGRKTEDDYLSVECSTNLRGIAAIGIILHHMSERTTDGRFFGYMAMTGYLFVAFFFFMSGYGLLVQYQKKKEKYLDGFLKKRLLFIVVVYLCDVAFYTIVKTLMGYRFTFLEILKSIFITGIANNSWYMVVLILFYFSFYFVFKCKIINSVSKKIFYIFLIETIFLIFCLIIEANPMWYLSNYGFVFGMLWAYYKEKIDGILESKYAIALICVVIITAFLNISPVLTDKSFSADAAFWIRTLFRLVSPVSLVALFFILVYKFKPSLFVWKWLGGISLEIYLIHGMVYTYFRSDVVYIESDMLWTLLTIVISVALAYPIHLLNKQLAKLLKR